LFAVLLTIYLEDYTNIAGIFLFRELRQLNIRYEASRVQE